ncbi:MAG: 50S ribosomal protein L13 [Candidatus Pacearchaeota archaeon]
MDEIVINADGCVVGRLASYVAKQALLGKKIIIVNSEKAIISGKKQNILDKYINRLQKGRGWQKGPYWPREAEKILRRIIRGMLPWKKARGKEAFKRIKCFKGVPKEYEGKAIEIKNLKKEFLNFITLGELEKLLRHK